MLALIVLRAPVCATLRILPFCVLRPILLGPTLALVRLPLWRGSITARPTPCGSLGAPLTAPAFCVRCAFSAQERPLPACLWLGGVDACCISFCSGWELLGRTSSSILQDRGGFTWPLTLWRVDSGRPCPNVIETLSLLSREPSLGV